MLLRLFFAIMFTVSLQTGCTWVCGLDRPSTRDRESLQLAERARKAEADGDLSEATHLLSQAARNSPSNADVHDQLAEVLLARGQRDQAIVHLNEAVRLTPDNGDTWYRLAKAYFDRRDFDKVDHPLAQALSYQPDHINALLIKAWLEEHRDATQSALATYHRILEIDMENVDARLRIAALHLHLKQPRRAAPLLRAISVCIHATPAQQADAFWVLGIAYGQLRRWEDASQTLSQAIEKKPQMTGDDWYRLAFASYKAERMETSRYALRSALRIDPRHAPSQQLAQMLNAIWNTNLHRVADASDETQPAPAPPGW